MLAAALSALLAATALAGGEAVAPSEAFGRSAQGRELRVARVGDPGSTTRVLVVGCVHGDECAGTAISRRLARGVAPGFDLWIVHQLNPDGFRRRTRQNGRGVDLNRNFPAGWHRRGRPWDATYTGARPGSEPETRAIMRLIGRVKPDVTVWYHQPQGLVRAGGGSDRLARRYARLAGQVFRPLPVPAGAATRWQVSRFPGSSAFVVELPAGQLGDMAAARHARAVRRLVVG